MTKDVEGWQVYIDPALLDGENQEAGARAPSILVNHLQRISIVVLAGPLNVLKKVGRWIEYSPPLLKTMQYRSSER